MHVMELIRRKQKTEDEVKLEAISKLAKQELRKIMNFGIGFPVIDYKYEI